MRTTLAEHPLDYDGGQLRSGWLTETFGLELGREGAAAAFVGACDVKPEFVVDLEERASGEPIRAARMAHVIAELPEKDLEKTVLRQRLLAALACEELARRLPGRAFLRRGDDLYEGGHKLSVSIATLSPRSALIHFAVNVDPAGAPVPARGLADYGIEPGDFARAVLEAFAAEMGSARAATARVRPVP